MDRKFVEYTVNKEVREALTKNRLIGAKQMNELEDKIYGKVMFEMQFKVKSGAPQSGRDDVSEYSEQTISMNNLRARP